MLGSSFVSVEIDQVIAADIISVGNPQDFQPAYNPSVWYFDSLRKSEPGYRYFVEVYDSANAVIGSYRFVPAITTGYAVVDLTRILKNFVSFDDTTVGVQKVPNSWFGYYLKVYDEYSVPYIYDDYANPSGDLTSLQATTNTHNFIVGDQVTVALDGIDLVIERGEFVAIVGPSGSGKSTMMNLIGCLDRPSSGVVKIASDPTSELNDNQLTSLRSKAIGFVFQQFQLLPNTTAIENVMAPLLYQGVSSKQAKQAATEILNRLGLGERLNFDRNRLSGGQQQRVAIARALVASPDIVLADEPTGALDSKTGAQVIELLKELNKEGRTIILITHDLEIAASAPRRVFLRDGLIERDERGAK